MDKKLEVIQNALTLKIEQEQKFIETAAAAFVERLVWLYINDRQPCFEAWHDENYTRLVPSRSYDKGDGADKYLRAIFEMAKMDGPNTLQRLSGAVNVELKGRGFSRGFDINLYTLIGI